MFNFFKRNKNKDKSNKSILDILPKEIKTQHEYLTFISATYDLMTKYNFDKLMNEYFNKNSLNGTKDFNKLVDLLNQFVVYYTDRIQITLDFVKANVYNLSEETLDNTVKYLELTIKSFNATYEFYTYMLTRYNKQ